MNSSIEKKNIDFGLCCIHIGLKKLNVTPNRTCRLKTAQDKGIIYIQQLVINNCKAILKILKWNYENGIKAYRLPSDMFPHLSNSKYKIDDNFKHLSYSISFAKPILKEIGKTALKYGIRLSFHPGQYNQIGTPNKNVFENTIRDLYYHAKILDVIESGLDLGKNKGIICIHGGGIYRNKQQTIERWIVQFKLLPKRVRKRIALENCERCYHTLDCLKMCKILKIPLIFDLHHFNCYNLINKDNNGLDEQRLRNPKKFNKLLKKIVKTWNRRKLKPYFHISEQAENGKIGKHSDYITTIPEWLLNVDFELTLDVEAKAKEKAILYLKHKYKI